MYIHSPTTHTHTPAALHSHMIILSPYSHIVPHWHVQVDGILVQLPLPSHIDEKTVCYSVTPDKDVDGFHFHNIGKYCAGEPGGALIPATPLGVLEIIKRCNIPTYGKNVCIAGRSKNIGMLNTWLWFLN